MGRERAEKRVVQHANNSKYMRFFYFQELGEFENYFSLSKSISVLISELIRIIRADISATTDNNYNVCIFILNYLIIHTHDIIHNLPYSWTVGLRIISAILDNHKR